MPLLTRAQLEAIQSDTLADDLAIDVGRMSHWSEADARKYFESGGQEIPSEASPLAAPPAPAAPSAARAQSDAKLAHFLADNKLESHASALQAETLASLLELLDLEGRAALLDRLKELGVASPPIRQKVAKALASYARGTGVPLLVCFFSGGMTLPQGQSLLKQWLERAASDLQLKDQVVLPHIGEPGCGCESVEWADYIDWCQSQVYANPEDAMRPVVIVGHSHGAVASYALARRLGKRVLKLCVVCRRPPHAPLLDEVLEVDCGAKMIDYDASKLIERFHAAWSNPVLAPHVGKPETTWPSLVTELVDVIRKQYTYTPGGSTDFQLVTGVERKPISAPVFAVAAGQEAPLGETFAKMQSWKELTSGTCEVEKVDASHMGCMKFGHGGVFDRLVQQISPIVAPLIEMERARKQLAGEEMAGRM